MRDHLISLAQHCCNPVFWSQKLHRPVLTRHVHSWFPILRNLILAAGARRSALSGARVIGLSEAQSYFGGVVRMTSAVNASQGDSSLKNEKYMFGPWNIDSREVFLVTEHCFCFVNLRPVVPDVLVSTKKLVPRFTDLTAEEATDLWLTAQRVGKKLEPFFDASSLTLAIQDGPEAGQTVPHVHVHILPRKKKDFENNDEIYDAIDNKEAELNQSLKNEEEGHLNLDEERKDRSREEMFEEASKLRTLF